MNIARTVCIKYSFFILLALLTSGAALVHGTAFAQEETFLKVGEIDVPGGLNSFDIGFVDPKIGRYFLADRTNKTVDDVKTSNNSIKQLAKGEFFGLQPGTNTSGPNGVITANNHTEVWAADGVQCSNSLSTTPPATTCGNVLQTSRIQVIDLKTGNVTHTIDNGGNRRADELCEDPQHHVVLVANDDDSDLFLTFISTNTYEILGKIKLDGTDANAQKINATDGIEQCQWSPRTGKFYLAVPEVNGDGHNTQPGAVLEIDPVSLKVQNVFAIDFGFLPQTGTPGNTGFTPATGACLGPQGMAIGPQGEILLGCSNGGTIGTAPNIITVAVGQGSVIINERNGDLVRSLAGLNGNDEVWYNPGNNHYFLAGGNHNLALPRPGPILGVADQRPDTIDEDASPATAAGSHSVAADPVFNQVYVPGNKAATSICPGGNGCIAVFMSANHDDGICGGKETAFKRQVCPGKNGHPGEN
jgi:hypothetical protein